MTEKIKMIELFSGIGSQAGNSIAVPCLVAIFKALYIDESFAKDKGTLDGWSR